MHNHEKWLIEIQRVACAASGDIVIVNSSSWHVHNAPTLLSDYVCHYRLAAYAVYLTETYGTEKSSLA